MTREVFTPSPLYTISTAGPHPITHPYQVDTEIACIIFQGTTIVELANGTDFTVSPSSSETTGDVTLSAAIFAAYTGADLLIRRISVADQGWVGQTAREKGLEAQLDGLTQRLQEIEEAITRAIKIPSGTIAEMPLDYANTFPFFDASKALTMAAGVTGVPATPYMATLLDDPDAKAARETLGNFDTFSDLENDTTLTTDTTPVGTIVMAQGWRYEAVASGGDITSAGGVQWDVLPNQDGLVNAAAFGVDGLTDDTAAALKAIQAAENGVVFEGDVLISSPFPYTVEEFNCYLPVEGKENFVVNCAQARFIVGHDFVTTGDRAALFCIAGSNNTAIDAVNVYGEVAKNHYLTGIMPVVMGYNATRGSNNLTVGSIDCENMSAAFTAKGKEADYTTNGLASVFRSKNIKIGNIHMRNGDLASAGYGVQLQLSGDGFSLGYGRLENAHRAIIAYGVRNVYANFHATNGAAALISLGGYGSIENIEVKLKEDGQDTTVGAAANIAQILVHEVGMTGGASIDLTAGRAHFIKNINLKLDVDVASRSGLCYVGKEDSVGGTDSNILFSNINVYGNAAGVNKGAIIGKGYSTTPTAWGNTVFENIRVRDMVCDASSQVQTHSGFVNSPVFENFVTNAAVFCSYDGSNIDYPVVFKNCTIDGELTTSSSRDVLLYLENCHLNQVGASGVKLPAHNKIMVNTRIGSSDPITKRRDDIWTTFSSNPAALYDPADIRQDLVGGYAFSGGSDAAITMDLVAESLANKPTSTTSRAIDHASFSSAVADLDKNTKAFKLYVSNSANSAVAIYTGYVSLYGDALTDFSATTIKLHDVQVTNVVGAAYLVADLAVSAPTADTIRFSMSRASRYSTITLYDN